MSLDDALPRWPVPPVSVLIHTSPRVRDRLNAYAAQYGLDPTEVVLMVLDTAATTGSLAQLFEVPPARTEQLRRRPPGQRARKAPLVLFTGQWTQMLLTMVSATGAGTLDLLVDRVVDKFLPPCAGA